jgi:hypothetical protein
MCEIHAFKFSKPDISFKQTHIKLNFKQSNCFNLKPKLHFPNYLSSLLFRVFRVLRAFVYNVLPLLTRKLSGKT